MVTAEGICDLHRRFCELLPEDLLWIEEPTTKERIRIVPGEIRRRDVQVGRHVAISPGALPRFLARFAFLYGTPGKTDALLAAASAHHRLLWITLFRMATAVAARVARAVAKRSRHRSRVVCCPGLARNVQDYKRLLANCDLPRRNDLDGRGSLSEEALGDFTEFFLRVGLDQVSFMESLMQPDRLRTRILLRVEEEVRMGLLPTKTGAIFSKLFSTVASLLDKGVIVPGETGLRLIWK